MKSVEDALTLFERAATRCGPALTGFELMPRIGVEFTARHIPGVRDPMDTVHPWYTLIDISTADSAEGAERLMQDLLEQAIADGLVENAVLAASETQRKALWHMRESMSPAQKPEGGSIKHDISVPVAAIPAFMAQADAAVLAAIPGARLCSFGHMGDGNIHYNISNPSARTRRPFSTGGARSTISSTASRLRMAARSRRNMGSASSNATNSPPSEARSKSTSCTASSPPSTRRAS